MGSLCNFIVVGAVLIVSSTGFADTTSPLDYALLKRAIQSESIGSFDELLRLFNRSPAFEALLDNPVLNERSKALHRTFVSPSFPRIIMTGGNLTMMVLGDPRLDESQLLEIIEFLPSTRSFAFRAINFHAKGTDEEFIDDANSANFKQFKDPTFKGVTNCSACHQMEAKESRPRWMTGPIWQTPFGEVDSTLHAGAQDFENWKLFQTTYADSVLGARYRALKLSPLKQLDDGSLLFVDRPNQKLTNFLDGLNSMRVARIIEDSPNYKKFEPAIIASFFSCGEMSEFLPATEVTARETAVRESISHDKRGIYVRGRIEMSLLDPVALKPFLEQSFRIPPDDPTVIEIDDAEFLQVAHLPLEDILMRTVRATSDISLTTAIVDSLSPNFLPIDLTGLIENGIDFKKLSPAQVPHFLKSGNSEYYPVLAKLRYLLEDSVEEKPVFWSISKSSPFGDSYDFGDDLGGTSQILSNGLSQHIFADYPQFEHMFLDRKLTRKNLTISESDFCGILKAAQKDATQSIEVTRSAL